jgi:hypothetical protein
MDEAGKHSNEDEMQVQCKCNRFIGISTDMAGDFIAFRLNKA